MGDDLFQDLPPPSQTQSTTTSTTSANDSSPNPPPPPPPPSSAPPPPPLKSALKRSKPSTELPQHPIPDEGSKRIKFKMTSDASEAQVIEAMKKIKLHIKNASKFSKASKLAIQLIEAKSVKPETSDYFISILASAMSCPITCNEPSVRADYHALFSAAQDTFQCLNKKQQNLLTTWTIRAVLANDLFTDDSFMFSKATAKIREAISSLPIATKDDDLKEGEDLKEDKEMVIIADEDEERKEETDPFGLDALIGSRKKKDDKVKIKREKEEEEEESKRFLRSKREGLITCLEIAAKRYKIVWCQTSIDILVKFAFDNVLRFTMKQRDAIEKLWGSVKEQQTRRKQGKSVSGKLDVNGFEWLQQKYAGEKISIRHSVGGSGARHCEQWLG